MSARGKKVAHCPDCHAHEGKPCLSYAFPVKVEQLWRLRVKQSSLPMQMRQHGELHSGRDTQPDWQRCRHCTEGSDAGQLLLCITRHAHKPFSNMPCVLCSTDLHVQFSKGLSPFATFSIFLLAPDLCAVTLASTLCCWALGQMLLIGWPVRRADVAYIDCPHAREAQ